MKDLRVVIVEDEPAIARNLAHLLLSLDNQQVIAAMLPTVADSVAWFKENETGYDLVFMDIRLADGLSFDIFKQIPLSKPVIFVTAYNDYALPAFKHNGLDYILKPFDPEEIKRALVKYRAWTYSPAETPPLAALAEQLQRVIRSYKRSFLVHYRDKLVPVASSQVAWFYTAHEIVYAHTADDRQYVIEFTLEQLEQQLDPAIFYRANRQFIINKHMVAEVDFYFNGRLTVKVKPEPPERILISKARVTAFRNWMDS